MIETTENINLYRTFYRKIKSIWVSTVTIFLKGDKSILA